MLRSESRGLEVLELTYVGADRSAELAVLHAFGPPAEADEAIPYAVLPLYVARALEWAAFTEYHPPAPSAQ